MSEDDNETKNGAHMSPELRQHYLQMMGIQVWQSRFQSASVAATPDEKERIPQAIETAAETEVSDAKQAVPDGLTLEKAIHSCVACELHQTKTKSVVAEGSHAARVMLIATAPAFNAESDAALLTAASSQLLSKMLQAIDIQRADVFLTGLVKCQLADDRELRTTEVLCCEQYLSQQIEMLKPELIIAFGELSAQHLLVSKKSLQELSAKVYQYHSRPLMVMPSADELLINPQNKRLAWHQLLRIKQKLND
ncbi:MAG: uracil-DNA glycosylase [Gammaproteobacteria bacterium]|nr:uracil-DNA glycosylase [Gammaproteobacteria bacterium]